MFKEISYGTSTMKKSAREYASQVLQQRFGALTIEIRANKTLMVTTGQGNSQTEGSWTLVGDNLTVNLNAANGASPILGEQTLTGIVSPDGKSLTLSGPTLPKGVGLTFVKSAS